MGPKPKGKGKNVPESPKINKNEIVSELDKEFFEFQLSEIEKKLHRIEGREVELRAGTLKLEKNIDEYKKEKGLAIEEQEQQLAMKEEEKFRKREEAFSLAEELKARIRQHAQYMEELKKKYNEMVVQMTKQLEKLEEEVKVLEDFKARKEEYLSLLTNLESQMEESEMQHQRNLFYIDQKAEIAKHRVKKELQVKLLQLSIEFRQTTQKRIGKPSHRITQENKAIENELILMRRDITEYEEKYASAKKNVEIYKHQNEKWLLEKDKGIARILVQMSLKKALLRDRLRLLEKQKEYFPFEAQNKGLSRKLKTLTLELERITREIDDVKQNLEKIVDATNEMIEGSNHLKKTSRKLNLHVRNALKITEEARAVKLIPMGGMEEEQYITTDARIRLFKKRRDSTFRRKGKILHYLFEFLLQGQLTDEDKKFLRKSTVSFDIDTISFTHIFKKALGDREEGREGSLAESEEEMGPYVGEGSETSLPRSVTPTEIRSEEKSESESLENEMDDELGEKETDEEEMKEMEEGEEEPKTEGETNKSEVENDDDIYLDF